MKDWVAAAEVAKSSNRLDDLLDYTISLSILHRCPESDWPDLVERMLAGHWTKEMTERYVDVVKTLEMVLHPQPGSRLRLLPP